MIDINANLNIINTLTTYLRGYLYNIDNYSNFCNKNYSKVKVFAREPNELTSFPIIAISSTNGQMITSGLGDIAMEIYDPNNGDLIGYKYHGMYELSISLEIGCENTNDRDVLTDLVMTAYRLQLRRLLESVGILIKDMRFAGLSEVPYDSDRKIYISTIQFTTWSEWTKDVYLLSSKDIDMNNIKIDIGG